MAKVSLVQIASPDSESRDERVERVEELLEQHFGSELYVLPELWSAGYFSFANYPDLAETLDGPTVSMGRRVAQRLEAWVHLGSVIERDIDGRLFNTALLITPRGEIAHRYRKVHVFGYESEEAQLLTPGSEIDVVPTPFGDVASTTCYDLRFPGLWDELGAKGAEVIAVPAAWPAARQEHWQVLTSARAVEQQAWILAVNSCGVQGDVQLGGRSRVVDPTGRLIGECGDDEEVLTVELDSGFAARVRAEFPVLRDRLPDYGSLDQSPRLFGASS